MKLRKHLEEAQVIKFKSQRHEDLEAGIDEMVKVLTQYVVALAKLDKRLSKNPVVNADLLDQIGFGVVDVNNLLKKFFPVNYRGKR